MPHQGSLGSLSGDTSNPKGKDKMNASIMQKTEPTNDLLSQMKAMLAPVSTEQSLSQQFATLPEVQQRQVISFAQLIKQEWQCKQSLLAGRP